MRYVQFFRTEDHNKRTEAYEWWPYYSGAEDGKLYFYKRANPGDVWGAPSMVAKDIDLVGVRQRVNLKGYTTEVEVD